MEVILSLHNDQQYLWSVVQPGHIGCILESYLDESLTYKRSESILSEQDWDSEWDYLQPSVQFLPVRTDSQGPKSSHYMYSRPGGYLCEEVELIEEDSWVTYGIYIWFCENLLMWAARVGVG